MLTGSVCQLCYYEYSVIGVDFATGGDIGRLLCRVVVFTTLYVESVEGVF